MCEGDCSGVRDGSEDFQTTNGHHHDMLGDITRDVENTVDISSPELIASNPYLIGGALGAVAGGLNAYSKGQNILVGIGTGAAAGAAGARVTVLVGAKMVGVSPWVTRFFQFLGSAGGGMSTSVLSDVLMNRSNANLEQSTKQGAISGIIGGLSAFAPEASVFFMALDVAYSAGSAIKNK
ncbi:MAG: hypothetical protein HQM14_21935 [SAR324 cluster bacterium]|nr:hypothetical protein [SAR324 cluster bacterium]